MQRSALALPGAGCKTSTVHGTWWPPGAPCWCNAATPDAAASQPRPLYLPLFPNCYGPRYPYVVHAEANALLNKNEASVSGARIYVTMFPCNECAKLLIQVGALCICARWFGSDGSGVMRCVRCAAVVVRAGAMRCAALQCAFYCVALHCVGSEAEGAVLAAAGPGPSMWSFRGRAGAARGPNFKIDTRSWQAGNIRGTCGR